MATDLAQAMKIFICYAREDEPLLRNLEKHLRALKRQGLIDPWHDREIIPGTDWKQEIDKQLNAADIILLLVSPDFIDSEYCYSTEMKRAMERGEAYVIPIILRHTYWKRTPFSRLQALPTDARPITDRFWSTIDEAFFSVTEGISETISQIQQIRNEATAYRNKGVALYGLKRYEEAIAAFDQALHLNPNDANAYCNKGYALAELKRYEEAIAAYDQALRLNPNYAAAYNNKGYALNRLGMKREAQQVYERARQLGYNTTP